MAAIERELHERLALLKPEQQQQVLDYARSLSEAPRRGVPGAALLRFAGTMSPEDAAEMARVIEEGCEGVDLSGW
jgi:hypothetical protein